MRIFIDNGNFKFFIEDSYSSDLYAITESKYETKKNTIVTINIDNEHKEYPARIKRIISITKEIIKAAMSNDYFDEIITSVRFVDIKKETTGRKDV